MSTIKEIRKNYPQYDDMSDRQLADALHAKHYSDIPKDEFYSKVGIETNNKNEQLDRLKKQHPYLMKLAERLQGNKALESAGNAADYFNQGVEGTGLPNAARGFFQSAQNLIRGPSNLIPGVNIKDARFSDYPIRDVNPATQRLGELAGGLAGFAPAAVGQEALQGAKALQSIPSLMRRVGSGAAIGSAVSPDSRTAGALVGGLGSLLPGIAEEADKFKPINPAESIQKRYDSLNDKLSKEFVQVGEEAKKHGIDKVKIGRGLFEEVKDLGPKTKNFARFVDKAKDGDYGSLRKLQTELWKRAERYKSSDLASEQDLGDEIAELRTEINDSIANHFEEKGRPELADKLRDAMKGYRTLMETYHAHPKISALVGENRKEPANILNLLKEKSEQMKRIKHVHPEIEKALKDESYKNKLDKYLKLGTNATKFGGALKLYDLIRGD